MAHLVRNEEDTLHEEIHFSRELIVKLVEHLVENDVYTLHEERIHLMGTNYIGYIDMKCYHRSAM